MKEREFLLWSSMTSITEKCVLTKDVIGVYYLNVITRKRLGLYTQPRSNFIWLIAECLDAGAIDLTFFPEASKGYTNQKFI